jgi:predicted enzyme related to lactoylglutathione lyase
VPFEAAHDLGLAAALGGPPRVLSRSGRNGRAVACGSGGAQRWEPPEGLGPTEVLAILAAARPSAIGCSWPRLRTGTDLNAAYPACMTTRIAWKLELVLVPVSDVDRAKAFYVDQVGFNADHDRTVDENLRFVQLTPHGSACSIAIGTGLTSAAPGSVEGLQLVVADIEAAHAELTERGVPVSHIHDLEWGSFVYFADPDGNRWAVQQFPARGRSRPLNG